MKTLKITSLALLLVFMTSCKVSINTLPEKTITSSQQTPNNISLNGKVFSALWHQISGEFRALCYQA